MDLNEKNNVNGAPEVRFTFKDDGLTNVERTKEIEKMIKKRNEILKSFGYTINEDGSFIRPEEQSDVLRQSR